MKIDLEVTVYQAEQIELALIDREIKLKKLIDADYFKPQIDESKIPEELSEIRTLKRSLATTMLLELEIQRKVFEGKEENGNVHERPQNKKKNIHEN